MGNQRRFDLTKWERTLRACMREDYQKSGRSRDEVADVLEMAPSTFMNAINPDTLENSPTLLSVEKWIRFLILSGEHSSFVEAAAHIGYALLPTTPPDDERDPMVAVLAATKELGDVSGKLVAAKRKDSPGGRKVTVAEAREIGKEARELAMEVIALLFVIEKEAAE